MVGQSTGWCRGGSFPEVVSRLLRLGGGPALVLRLLLARATASISNQVRLWAGPRRCGGVARPPRPPISPKQQFMYLDGCKYHSNQYLSICCVPLGSIRRELVLVHAECLLLAELDWFIFGPGGVEAGR